MAEEVTSQSLPEFIRNCMDDLTSGALTPEEAYVAMRQYAPLRYVLDRKKEELAQKLAKNEDIKGLLVDILKLEIPAASKEPNPLDEAKSPAEIAARAKAFQEAEVRTNTAIKNKLPNLEKNRQTYARRVAVAFNEEMVRRQIYGIPLETIEKKVVQATEKIPAATSKEETREILTSAIQVTIAEDTSLSPHKEALRAATQAIEPPDVFIEAAKIREQTNRIILENPDIARPDLLVTFVAQGVETQKAASLTRVAEALSLDINPTIDPTRPSVFFQAVATTGLQKLAAPAADAILTVLPQGTREQIIETVLTKSWERVTKNLDQKFGEAVVSSPLFKQAIANGNHAFEKPTAPGGVAAGASKFIGDAFTSVFGSGIDQAIISKYLETGKRVSVTPGVSFAATGAAASMTFLQFYTAFVNEHNPSHFSPIFEGGKWVLGFAGRKIAGAAARGIATKISGTAIGAAIGTAIPIPIVGNIIGAAVGFIGSKVIGGAINGVKNLLGGGFIQRLFSGEPGRWQDDLPLLAAAIVLAPIILIFLLPTFLNPQFLGTTSQASALADTQGIGVGGAPIDCTATPDIPECKLVQCQGDCRWPIDTSTHACISEGPYIGTHSRSHLSAVDFLTPGNQGRLFGVPVYTQYAGTVASAIFGYLDNSGYTGSQDGGTYGNHVTIRTDSGALLLFAHLRNIQTVTEGSKVAAGTVVGFVDHTGYSGGVHLHYEVRRPGDINNFLPFPVPPCGSVSDCNAKLKALGHSACL